MGALEVDTFTRCVCRNKYANVLILLEQGFDLAALVSCHATVNCDNTVVVPEQ